MPFPVIWAVGAVVVAAAKKGIDAATLLKQASETQKQADELKSEAEQRLENNLESVRAEAMALEAQKLAVMEGAMARFVALWERQKKKASISDKDFALNLNLSEDKLEEFKRVGFKSLELAGGITQAAAAGVVSGVGVTSAVTALGTAGTGAAISGLSGAAASNALLAWLGGGTLAAGGGGVALGTIVAGGLFVAPAALVGSLVAAKKGEEALTAATKYAADVEVYCAQLDAKDVALKAIEQRMKEMSGVISGVVRRLRAALDICEQDERDNMGAVKLEHFYAAASLAKTLSDLLSVPIIDEDITATLASRRAIDDAQNALN